MDADDHRLGALGTLIASVLGVLIGGFAGGITTLVHRQWVGAAPLPVPWGLIAGLAVLAAVLLGLRIVFDSRVVAAVAAVGMLGMIALFSLQGPGGSVLVADDALGWTWMIAPPVIAVAVVLWPQPRRPDTPRAST